MQAVLAAHRFQSRVKGRYHASVAYRKYIHFWEDPVFSYRLGKNRTMLWPALATVLLMTGCRDRESPPADSATAAAQVASADSAAELAQTLKTLPRPLDEMLDRDFGAWVHDNVDFKKSGSNDDSTTAGVHAEAGSGCNDHIPVSLRSAKGAKHVKWDNVGVHGVVVARIHNLSLTCRTSDTKLEPLQIGYWVVVRGDTAPSLRSRFVTESKSLALGSFEPCGHSDRPRSRSAFRDDGCGNETPANGAHPPGLTHNPQHWATCAGGCCKAKITGG